MTATAQLPDLNEMLAGAEQNISRLTPKLPVNFQFSWESIRFVARVEEHGNGVKLRLVGDLGPVPYSAEDQGERRRLLSLVRWADDLGECRFVVGQRHHLNLLGEAPIAAAATGTAIVASATNFLLHARPYIDLVQEQRIA